MKKQFALDIREVIEREMSDDGLFQIGRKVTKEEGQQLIVNDVNFVVVKLYYYRSNPFGKKEYTAY